MAVIKSGASTDNLTIDVTSKAARVSPYDSAGVYRGVKKTFRAATEVLVAAVTADVPWFIIHGSATKTITVKRIIVSGLSLTAVAYLNVAVGKHSTAASGGTSTTPASIPLDSTDTATAIVLAYTVAPTPGTLLGFIASRRTLAQATTAAAAGTTEQVFFDFGDIGESHGVVLRGIAQGLSLQWPVAPGSAVSLSVEIEWTEE